LNVEEFYLMQTHFICLATRSASASAELAGGGIRADPARLSKKIMGLHGIEWVILGIFEDALLNV